MRYCNQDPNEETGEGKAGATMQNPQGTPEFSKRTLGFSMLSCAISYSGISAVAFRRDFHGILDDRRSEHGRMRLGEKIAPYREKVAQYKILNLGAYSRLKFAVNWNRESYSGEKDYGLEKKKRIGSRISRHFPSSAQQITELLEVLYIVSLLYYIDWKDREIADGHRE